VETVPALKDMDWELGQWHPLVQDRKFLTWLVTVSYMSGVASVDSIVSVSLISLHHYN
jgi:hypothetical protein